MLQIEESVDTISNQDDKKPRSSNHSPQVSPMKGVITEDEEALGNMSLYAIMKPLFICLKLCGLVFSKDYSNCSITGKPSPQMRWHAPSVSEVWTTFILIVRWFDFLRHFPATGPPLYDNNFMSQVAILIWKFQCVMCATILYFICMKNMITTVFIQWEDYHKRYVKCNIELKQYLRKCMIFCMVVSTLFGCLFTLSNIYILFIAPTTFFWTVPFPDEGTGHQIGISILLTISVFQVSGTYVPLTWFCIVTLALGQEFRKVQLSLKSQQEQKAGCKEDEFSIIRLRHLSLCNLTSVADNMFSHMIGILFLTNVSVACLLCYLIIDLKPSGFMLAVLLLWTISAFVCFIGVSIVAAYTNRTVSRHYYIKRLVRKHIPGWMLLYFHW